MPLSIDTVFAGLVGSIATAGLSYVVQNVIAKRRHAEEERRLAYVYLVKVSQLLAHWTAVAAGAAPTMQKAEEAMYSFLQSPLLQQVASGERGYETLHAMCAVVSVGLRAENGEAIRKSLRASAERLRPDELLSLYAIAPSDLADFPRAAVVAYCAFEDALGGVRGAIYAFKHYVESGDKAACTAEVLLGHAVAFIRMKNAALSLRQALADRCGLDKNEADKILREQMKSASRFVVAFLEDMKKARAASADLEAVFKKMLDDVRELLKKAEELRAAGG